MIWWLVEGLRRAGTQPTGGNRGIATTSGGLEVMFSPASHSGLDYTDLSIECSAEPSTSA